MRADGRTADQIRPLILEPGFIEYPEGSILYRAGGTIVLCNVSLSDRTPGFLRGTGEGWVTAEYAMLPRATDTRSDREVNKGRQSGRSQEIQRLIGRSLRAGIRRDFLGERTLTADCDVLQADGSTRCASISGAWTSTVLALAKMYSQGLVAEWPVKHQIAAVSVGLVGEQAIVDLDYGEDFDCDVDLNLVFTEDGRMIEVQGTAEGEPFSRDQFHSLIEIGWTGAQAIMKAQNEAIAPALEAAGIAMGT